MTWGDQGAGIWLSCRKQKGMCTASTDNLLNQLPQSWIHSIMQWYTVQWYLHCLSGPAPGPCVVTLQQWSFAPQVGADSGLKRAIWVRPETAHETFTHFTKEPSVRSACKMMKSVWLTLRSGGAPDTCFYASASVIDPCYKKASWRPVWQSRRPRQCMNQYENSCLHL